jgi:hypothetical protein
MKTRILDSEPFKILNPADIAVYLQSKGWVKHKDQPGYCSIWFKQYQGETADLLLPVDRGIRDYVTRMIDAVRLVAAIEDRSETEVLSDFQYASTDVIRFRFSYADAADGSIPLLQGERLVENAKEMFLAAGSAVISRRAYFATNRPEEVREFVQNLRMGQSERGSYILTLLSRVTPVLKQEQQTFFDDPEPPFERKAVAGLNTALIALRDAVDQAATNFTAKVFQDAVAHGVSANLCQALVNMNATNPQPVDQLRFGFTWARSRPNVTSAVNEVSFRAETFPIIAEAARVLKAVAPQEDQEIQGYVVKLQQRDDGGVASVATVIDGQPRKVKISLIAEDHQRAIVAYDRRVEVRCRGNLIKNGQLWSLKEPGRVYLVADDETD